MGIGGTQPKSPIWALKGFCVMTAFAAAFMRMEMFFMATDNRELMHIMYIYLYENDHFNQAQAEFKKELNGQSKPVAQKKKKEKKEGVYHALREWLECMVHTLLFFLLFFLCYRLGFPC